MHTLDCWQSRTKGKDNFSIITDIRQTRDMCAKSCTEETECVAASFWTSQGQCILHSKLDTEENESWGFAARSCFNSVTITSGEERSYIAVLFMIIGGFLGVFCSVGVFYAIATVAVSHGCCRKRTKTDIVVAYNTGSRGGISEPGNIDFLNSFNNDSTLNGETENTDGLSAASVEDNTIPPIESKTEEIVTFPSSEEIT